MTLVDLDKIFPPEKNTAFVTHAVNKSLKIFMNNGLKKEHKPRLQTLFCVLFMFVFYSY